MAFVLEPPCFHMALDQSGLNFLPILVGPLGYRGDSCSWHFHALFIRVLFYVLGCCLFKDLVVASLRP